MILVLKLFAAFGVVVNEPCFPICEYSRASAAASASLVISANMLSEAEILSQSLKNSLVKLG